MSEAITNFQPMKFKSLAFLLIILFTLNGFSQHYKWSVYPSLGIDMGGAIPFPFSDIPKGMGGSPKLTPNLGIGGEYKLDDRWFLAFEINYVNLTFTGKAEVRSQPFYQPDIEGGIATVYFTGYTTTDVELRQIVFPLVATYRAGKNWAIPFGIYYSRILDGKFQTLGYDGYLSVNKEDTDNAVMPGYTDVPYNFNEDLDSYDYGILFGYRYNFNHRLYFWSRFHIGFKSIFKKEFYNIDYEMYQLRVSIGASYNLFYPKNESDRVVEARAF